MNMKKWMAPLLSALLLVSLAACGGSASSSSAAPAPESTAAESTAAPASEAAAESTGDAAASGDAITVGFSFNALMNDVFTKTEEYCKSIGEASVPQVNFIITSADNDVSKQIADVNDLISQKPDVIIICPEDSAATDTMIKACNDANIPVMIQNRPYNPDGQYKPDTFVGVDAQDQGYASTKELFDLMIADGLTELNLILISGALTDENSVLRTAGVMEAIEEYADKGANLVTELTTDWDPDWLESNLPSAMRANPQTNCLYIASDFLLPATQAGLEATNQWIKNGEEGHIYIASTDVYEVGLQGIADGYVDTNALFDIVGMCETIVDYSIKMANGETPDEIYVKGPVFNAQNYEDPDLQALLWG